MSVTGICTSATTSTSAISASRQPWIVRRCVECRRDELRCSVQLPGAGRSREGQRKASPSADDAGHCEIALHRPREVAADGEAESYPTLTLRRAGAELHEGIEDPAELLRRDARTRVRDDGFDRVADDR